MYLGTQNRVKTDDEYRQFVQLGITRICADPEGHPDTWTLDALEKHRDRLDGLGLSLDMIQLPLQSTPIEKQTHQDILLAGPNRDRQIDAICQMISDLGTLGIPAAKYNLNLIGIPRTPDEPGRGGSRNAAFRWDLTDQNTASGLAGELSEDENWERIDT
ncbi:MAG: mannonate dehydratase, partial [Deltaproteobacteria bacterium]